ncbi:hypothetical protein BB559_007501 [Furculomyces boomerangus]|nr:hypothetical protein BB559_007501 [Furculomyces boomerangus]
MKPGVEKISFGYLNTKNTNGNTIWIKSSEINTFNTKTQNITLGSKNFKNQNTVVLNPKYQDSYFPSNVVGYIKDQVAKSGNCTYVGHIPIITFYIDDNMFTLRPRDYMAFVNGVCVPTIQEIDYGKHHSDSIILGQNFFKKYVVTFDYDKRQIGFTL